MSEKLFVYGTLKSDCPSGMNSLLGPQNPCAGKGSVRGRMLAGTPYPALEPCEDAWVEGEVYELKEEHVLSRLDEYEGEDYIRRKTFVKTANNTGIQAWIYYYSPCTSGHHQF